MRQGRGLNELKRATTCTCNDHWEWTWGKGWGQWKGGSKQVGGRAGRQESEETMVANEGRREGGIVTDQCPRTQCLVCVPVWTQDYVKHGDPNAGTTLPAHTRFGSFELGLSGCDALSQSTLSCSFSLHHDLGKSSSFTHQHNLSFSFQYSRWREPDILIAASLW